MPLPKIDAHTSSRKAAICIDELKAARFPGSAAARSFDIGDLWVVRFSSWRSLIFEGGQASGLVQL